jgi:hypothetical protein
MTGSRVLQESQGERCKHQDDADVRYQSFPESMPEEQQINTDDNRDQDHNVQDDEYIPHVASTAAHNGHVAPLRDEMKEMEVAGVEPASWSVDQEPLQVYPPVSPSAVSLGGGVPLIACSLL